MPTRAEKMARAESGTRRDQPASRWPGLLSVAALLTLLLAVYLYPYLTAEPPLPELADTWWLRSPRPDVEDTVVRPFSITSPPGLMDDIRARLTKAESRLTPPLEGAAFNYGFNSDYLREVMEHWRTKYDWNRRLQHLNQFSQFKTNVNGLDIHFIHVKPKVPSDEYRVEPLLLLHGWPGSVVEFYSVLPLLTAPRPGHRVVFEVVCPSLPGYGFSSAAERPGLGAPEVAAVMRKLMQRLGFERFFVQGGDWGGIIASHMGTLFPEQVAGVHTNFAVADTWRMRLLMALGSIVPSWAGSEFFTSRLYPLGEKLAVLARETGYAHLQATKPDTVGVALSDSPAGLAAYILEKFSSWTDMTNVAREDGGLTRHFSLDALLDNVMVYWLSGSVTSSLRLYAETFGRRVAAMQLDAIPCRVPVGLLYAPNELMLLSPAMLAGKFVDVVAARQLGDGGHFLAMERPHELAEHVFVTVTAIRRREELQLEKQRQAEQEKQRQRETEKQRQQREKEQREHRAHQDKEKQKQQQKQHKQHKQQKTKQ
ncbi:juvenile hormone epoxide hydrolase 1-like [Pollicipes pollicipes]|uniref:juvenile hormone epoxide hydrolase 1-like n=1 Tax=Pollicipes pollicipes TaxID=41117 RepID=UPI0018852C5E|nr:juvenile hormone epoxide hydrolase 1-like [Pollicipes pollicipes]